MSEIPEPKIIKSHRSSITIQITENGELIVKAPFYAPKFAIQKFIDSKKDWILKTLERTKKRLPIKREYIEDEKFLYLGKEYNLKIGKFKEISLSRDNLNFPLGLLFRIKAELENWYIKQAKKVIHERLNYQAKQMGTNFKSVMFSDTKSKWGTCFHDNSLQFNWRLIMAPLMVMDYVIIHELTHTTEKNHSNDFWRNVGKFTPAYKQHRKWLNENGHLLKI